MKPAVRRFSKSDPCTKADFWRCFRGRNRFRSVPVAVAHGIIGDVAPRNWIKHRWIERVEVNREECYRLTGEGEQNLIKGIVAYLNNHPDKAGDIAYLPASVRQQGSRYTLGG